MNLGFDAPGEVLEKCVGRCDLTLASVAVAIAMTVNALKTGLIVFRIFMVVSRAKQSYFR